MTDERLVDDEGLRHDVAHSAVALAGHHGDEAHERHEPGERVDEPEQTPAQVRSEPGLFERGFVHDSQPHGELAEAPARESGKHHRGEDCVDDRRERQGTDSVRVAHVDGVAEADTGVRRRVVDAVAPVLGREVAAERRFGEGCQRDDQPDSADDHEVDQPGDDTATEHCRGVGGGGGLLWLHPSILPHPHHRKPAWVPWARR